MFELKPVTNEEEIQNSTKQRKATEDTGPSDFMAVVPEADSDFYVPAQRKSACCILF
jgi:hypothetical protein